jgi:peptidoglycan hydrolase CwlO-like protein
MYAGRKMPADVIEDQKTNQSQIVKMQSDIVAAEYSITQTMNRFGSYKARYLELRPRNQSLTYINANKKTLTELEAWKANANERLNSLLAQALGYKRAGASLPNYLLLGIQQSNEEIARADEEINDAKNNIKKTQQNFSK